MYYVNTGRGSALAVPTRMRRGLGPRVSLTLAVLAALLGPLCLARAARAQSEDGFDGNLDDSLASEKQASDEKKQGGKMPGEKEKKPEPEPVRDTDPLEKDGKAYRFIGLRFRDIIVPKFMIELFADGGATVNVFTIGPEFTTRKDGLEIDLALSYADYSMDPFLFKGKNDGNDAWEIVSSDMKMLYFTTDLLYEIPLDKEKGRFSLLVGGGLGLGVVLGNLYRTQAYPADASNLNVDDVGSWRKCSQIGAGGVDPGSGNVYCDGANNHYSGYDEPSWVNGGSKPTVFPWISFPQVSFRYKPIKQFQARVDAGFSITGFFFGMSAGYGL
jgi:hypothetical protein